MPARVFSDSPGVKESGGGGANLLTRPNAASTGGAVGVSGIDHDSTDAAFRGFQMCAANFYGGSDDAIGGEHGGRGCAGESFGVGEIGAATDFDSGGSGGEGESAREMNLAIRGGFGHC